MQELATSVRCAVEQRNFHAALALALAIPDIGGRLVSPGSPSGQRYKHWFARYVGHRYVRPATRLFQQHVFLEPGDCYALRCAFLHQGEETLDGQNARVALDRFRFITPPQNQIVHRNLNGEVLQLQVDIFCEDICAGVDACLAEHASIPDFQRRLADQLKISEFDGAI